MSLSLYLLCGLPWTIYAVAYQRQRYGWNSRIIAAAVLELAFWPVAPVLAAFLSSPDLF